MHPRSPRRRSTSNSATQLVAPLQHLQGGDVERTEYLRSFNGQAFVLVYRVGATSWSSFSHGDGLLWVVSGACVLDTRTALVPVTDRRRRYDPAFPAEEEFQTRHHVDAGEMCIVPQDRLFRIEPFAPGTLLGALMAEQDYHADLWSAGVSGRLRRRSGR